MSQERSPSRKATQLGREVDALPTLGFTVENGGGLVQQHFDEVVLHSQDVDLSFPEAGIVVDYLCSVREPVVEHVGTGLDFDKAIRELEQRLQAHIRRSGSFQAGARSGVFVCRR